MPLAPPLSRARTEPPKRPGRAPTLGKGACRIPSPPLPRPPRRTPAFDSETDSCIDQPPDCQRNDGPRKDRPWRLARGRSRRSGAAPRPEDEEDDVDRPALKRRAATHDSIDRGPPPRGCGGEGESRAPGPADRMSRRHLNRGPGPLQESGAFSSSNLSNPRRGTASGCGLDFSRRRPRPVARSESRLAAALVVPSRGRFSKYP